MDAPRGAFAEHDYQQHQDDQRHESDVRRVPVVALRTTLVGEAFRHDVAAQEFDVRLEQRVERAETFVPFGNGEEQCRNFRLSLESRRRLVGALDLMLRLEHLRTLLDDPGSPETTRHVPPRMLRAHSQGCGLVR